MPMTNNVLYSQLIALYLKLVKTTSGVATVHG